MKKAESIITGIWYKVVPANEEMKKLYSDIESIKISRNASSECQVWGYTDRCKERLIYTGSRGGCENWTLLTFDVNEKSGCLKIRLYDDIKCLRNTEDPIFEDIADRVEAAEKYVSSFKDIDYGLRYILENYYAERVQLQKDLPEQLTKETNPEDRQRYLETTDKIRNLTDRYLNLLKIQIDKDYGEVYFTEDFGKDIDDGAFNDDDGSAYFLDEEGNEGPSVNLWPGVWRIKDIDKYPYIWVLGK